MLILVSQEFVKGVHQHLALVILRLLDEVLCKPRILKILIFCFSTLDSDIIQRGLFGIVILNVYVEHQESWVLYFARLQLVSILLVWREADDRVFLADREVVDFNLQA